MPHHFKVGDKVISTWNNQTLELRLMEVADREPGDAVSEEDGNPPVWWCARTDGVNFSVAEDGNEEEDCEKLYRVLAGHDEDEYPLFQQCAYSQIYFKLLEPREWDNANN